MNRHRIFGLAAMLLVLIATVVIMVPASEARLSDNNRRAVVLEAFYALRPSHDGGCDKTINGNCVSNWNYLNNDPSAYGVVKGWYGCYSSVWTTSGDGSGCANNNYPISFYNNPASYGYGTFGGSYGNIGRGGQCKYFANLILYRSGSDQGTFPTYSNMWANTETDMTKAKEGDVILTYNNGITNHVAIVVEIKKDGNGQVTGLDVIDANFVSDISGTMNREVIGRHLFSISYLNQYYRIYKGTSYYGEPYIP